MNGYKVSILCLLLLLLGTAAHAKILFGFFRDGEIGKIGSGVKGIYVMDDDGSNLTLLIETKDEGGWKLRPSSARWSPNGQQILFRMGSSLYLMDADGTNIQRLPETSHVLSGSFSPDGKSIVYARDIYEGAKFIKHTITVMELATRKTKIIAEEDAVNCDWSPDGKQIVYDKPSGVGGGGGTIWIMGADGENPRPLIPAPPKGKFRTHRQVPRWSPDGKHVAFLQREYSWQRWPGLNPTFLIYHAHRYMICDRDGVHIQQLLIPKDYEAVSLDWMDDGASIVFTAIADAPIDEPVLRDFVWPPSYVYKYHRRTGDIIQLTNNPEWDQVIDWISDDALPVAPHGNKKKVTWGVLKK